MGVVVVAVVVFVRLSFSDIRCVDFSIRSVGFEIALKIAARKGHIFFAISTVSEESREGGK